MKPDVSAAVSILIVDDDRGQRSLLETFLRAQGYHTQSAASGEAALELLLVETAECAVAGKFQLLGVLVEHAFHGCVGRFSDRGVGAVSERPKQRDREEQAYQRAKKTDHGVLFLLRLVAVRQL